MANNHLVCSSLQTLFCPLPEINVNHNDEQGQQYHLVLFNIKRALDPKEAENVKLTNLKTSIICFE